MESNPIPIHFWCSFVKKRCCTIVISKLMNYSMLDNHVNVCTTKQCFMTKPVKIVANFNHTNYKIFIKFSHVKKNIGYTFGPQF